MSATMTAPNGGPLDARGKRALVYSLGLEGQDLASWLIREGAASVVISDTRSQAQLEAAGAVAPPGVDRVLTGRPFLDPAGFDLLAVSQSVLRYDPALKRARELGIAITSQMRLFLQLCPGRVVGITGSSGKSTTTALLGRMAAEAGIDHVVGGNIGQSMLAKLPAIRPETTVILEISHTQLQYTDRSPAIAAVTNVTPNHLDQFTWDEYVGLKRSILTHQTTDDLAVLNADDATSVALVPSVAGRLARTSIRGAIDGDGAWLENGAIRCRRGRRERVVLRQEKIRLRGEHNLANVVMAAALADALQLPDDAIARAAERFTGVAHRLEVVGRTGGVIWVDDSIATSPERTMAGLRAFNEPVVLLLGGREKHLPLDGLQALARERCHAIVCFGEAGPLFFDAMRRSVEICQLAADLPAAVATAAEVARSGDVVLLSPGGTSFDVYPNFEARGRAFCEAVRRLPRFVEEVPS
jgi:UDP-N-acetylmuramoylalanine--D-glutamate ligase